VKQSNSNRLRLMHSKWLSQILESEELKRPSLLQSPSTKPAGPQELQLPRHAQQPAKRESVESPLIFSLETFSAKRVSVVSPSGQTETPLCVNLKEKAEALVREQLVKSLEYRTLLLFCLPAYVSEPEPWARLVSSSYRGRPPALVLPTFPLTP
jgi:hypothetical protein